MANAHSMNRCTPATVEGTRKAGGKPARHARGTLDSIFGEADSLLTQLRTEGVIDPLRGDAAEGLLQSLSSNGGNTPGVRRKAVGMRRALRRLRRDYAEATAAIAAEARPSGGSGAAKSRARKAAKAAASRELRESLKNGGKRR
jgi:hypothetical protein